MAGEYGRRRFLKMNNTQLFLFEILIFPFFGYYCFVKLHSWVIHQIWLDENIERRLRQSKTKRISNSVFVGNTISNVANFRYYGH